MGPWCDSKQGSSTEGIISLTMSSPRAISKFEAGPNGCDLSAKDIHIEDLRLVECQGDCQMVELGEKVLSMPQRHMRE